MASNYTTPNNFTTENYSATNAPVWVIPTDSSLTSDKSMLITNNNQQLPTYNEFTALSVSEISDQPPNYFDISIVPNGAILFNNEVTPYTEQSKAEIQRTNKGVLSFDPLIDRNPDQLWLYFMTYLNEKPQQHVHIHGHYTEYYTTTESYTDSDGNTQSRDVQQSLEVTDFYFTIDLAPYICPQWWRIAVIRSVKAIQDGEFVSLRDALERYTLSEKSIKEIKLKKQLYGWNYPDLQKKIMALVRSTGYSNSVSITCPVGNTHIAARSSSQISRFANSYWVRVLCVISCLWIIFGPIYCCLRNMGSTRDQIIADYTMLAPTDTFLQLNAALIVNAVVARSHHRYLACLN